MVGGLAGGAAIVASIVLATSAAGKDGATAAAAGAATVASHVRDGLANIPRARVLPFTGAVPHVRFVPELEEMELLPSSQPRWARGNRARVQPSGLFTSKLVR